MIANLTSETREELERQADWVRASLACKSWHWDADEREEAENEYAETMAALASVEVVL